MVFYNGNAFMASLAETGSTQALALLTLVPPPGVSGVTYTYRHWQRIAPDTMDKHG